MRIISFILLSLINVLLSKAQSPSQASGNCTLVAYIIFDGPNVFGGIIFRGQQGGPIVVETMNGGLIFSTPSAGPFTYGLNNNSLPAGGSCSAAGGTADPNNVGNTTACNSAQPQNCQAGDLSGKHGKLSGQRVSFSYIEDFFSFQIFDKNGIVTVIGRSIVIFGNNGAPVACSNVTSVPPNSTPNPSLQSPTSTSPTNGSPTNTGPNSSNGPGGAGPTGTSPNSGSPTNGPGNSNNPSNPGGNSPTGTGSNNPTGVLTGSPGSGASNSPTGPNGGSPTGSNAGGSGGPTNTGSLSPSSPSNTSLNGTASGASGSANSTASRSSVSGSPSSTLVSNTAATKANFFSTQIALIIMGVAMWTWF